MTYGDGAESNRNVRHKRCKSCLEWKSPANFTVSAYGHYMKTCKSCHTINKRKAQLMRRS
ncbi:MAG: hypothetical protein OXC46_00925 [Thaumarchaeota archaeon]|nr:hypothetical protein [Nitrososphaerota archaeon]